MAHGDSADQALAEVQQAIALWIETVQADQMGP
jgi:predicted RNase H-like HicB family nuclease